MPRAWAEALTPLADFRLLLIAGAITVTVLVTIPFEVYFTPLARQFRIDNPYINYPLSPEHVPVSLLGFLSLLLPLGLITLAGIVDVRNRKHAIISILGLLMAVSSTMLVTDVFKILIGNQRPDFIDRCKPRHDAPRDVYVSVLDVCTQTDMVLLWEGCKSTPSGHSSLSFAGLGFLAIWFLYSFDLLRADRPIYVKAAGFTPMLISTYVAITRIIDHKHHYIDIISGSIIGTAIAYASYVYVVRDSKPERSTTHSPV